MQQILPELLGGEMAAAAAVFLLELREQPHRFPSEEGDAYREGDRFGRFAFGDESLLVVDSVEDLPDTVEVCRIHIEGSGTKFQEGCLGYERGSKRVASTMAHRGGRCECGAPGS